MDCVCLHLVTVFSGNLGIFSKCGEMNPNYFQIDVYIFTPESVLWPTE